MGIFFNEKRDNKRKSDAILSTNPTIPSAAPTSAPVTEFLIAMGDLLAIDPVLLATPIRPPHPAVDVDVDVVADRFGHEQLDSASLAPFLLGIVIFPLRGCILPCWPSLFFALY